MLTIPSSCSDNIRENKKTTSGWKWSKTQLTIKIWKVVQVLRSSSITGFNLFEVSCQSWTVLSAPWICRKKKWRKSFFSLIIWLLQMSVLYHTTFSCIWKTRMMWSGNLLQLIVELDPWNFWCAFKVANQHSRRCIWWSNHLKMRSQLMRNQIKVFD